MCELKFPQDTQHSPNENTVGSILCENTEIKTDIYLSYWLHIPYYTVNLVYSDNSQCPILKLSRLRIW